MYRAVITIRGRIQKVGYRDAVTEIANKMDITGTVENLPDGKSVKIIAEADKDILEEFIQLLWITDDPMIKVVNVETSFQSHTGEYEFFDIVYEDFQKEAFERIGNAAIYLKHLDIGQNKLLDKQDQMLDKQDRLIEKLDETRTDITGEIKELRGDLKSYMDRKFIKIEADISQIKEKIGLN